MTTLSDTQNILLSSAAQREGGSLWPLATSLKPGGGIAKAVTALIKQGLAEERETGDVAAARRSDGDLHFGVFITPAGAAAIGIEPQHGTEATAATVPIASGAPKAASKTTAVIALLSRPTGATLPQLIEATGWLPHTTRAALTGIRKRGHEVVRSKRDGATCYRINAVAA